MTRVWLRKQLTKLERWLAPGQFDQVREFVYLDEVSVRSLLASTGEGGIPSETTDENVRTSRVGGGGSVSVPTGTGSAGIEATGERQVTTSVKQVRNYDLIQSKFTKLHDSELVQKKLSLNQVPDNGTSAETFSDFAVSELERGDVLELRVNVSAYMLFRLYQTVDYFADIAEEQIDNEAEEVLDLIETSLGNSIPIIADAIDYRVVHGDDGKEIRRVTDIEDDDHLDLDDTCQLRVVSLLNLDDLWVDPIQTLFSNDEFVMYCRVEDVDIDSWYPLKATRAVSSLSSETAEELHQVFRAGLDEAKEQLSETQDLTGWSDMSVSRWVQDIERYTDYIESEYDISAPQEQRKDVLADAMESVDISDEDSKTAKRKVVLDAYTDRLIEVFDLESIDAETRVQIRETALAMDTELETSGGSEESDAIRVEAKTVALYW